jgi:hypothetical protein
MHIIAEVVGYFVHLALIGLCGWLFSSFRKKEIMTVFKQSKPEIGI